MTAQTPHDDDRPIGRVLSRREMLALLGSGAGATLLAACMPEALTSASASASASAAAPSPSASVPTAVPACVVAPALTEGPYYVDGVMERSDITTDPEGGVAREGAPLELTFAVARVSGSDCTAFEGAVVDLWHCDALGSYSGVAGGAGQGDTSGERWLRGYQVTDANGLATFTTIYPGWYPGRAVHMHFKVRTNPASNTGTEFTSQLFFDDALSTEIFTSREPYSLKGEQTTTNDTDSIFGESNGQLGLRLEPQGEGYAATFAIGVQLD